jgi:stress-induced morphogen
MDKRINIIKERLESKINAVSLSIEDQGYMHKGHTAHKAGMMHIWVEIVSDDFIDLNPIQRHQLVYGILGDELKGDLHALSLSLMTSKELEANNHGELND